MWWIDRQQEVLYVIYTDPETFEPTMKFFEIVAPSYNQDAPDLKQALLLYSERIC